MGRQIKRFAVIDLEATCWPNDYERDGQDQEIIEIGCVVLGGYAKKFEVLEEYQAFVRPLKSKISDFCTELTTITQADVDAAKPWYTVSVDFANLLRKHKISGWGSWGDFDRQLFERAAALYRIRNPLPPQHINLKLMTAMERGWNQELGLDRAMHRLGIPFEGTQHRALNDARATAEVFVRHVKEIWLWQKS